MVFSKFTQWIDHYSEKISLFHVIIFSCLFALISVVNHHGGVLHNEVELRLPFYMSDVPLPNKLFDSQILDMDMYQARELSYFLDFIDCKFIEFGIYIGLPHFLSLTHYLFFIATGCLLWLFCVKELNLRPLMGIGLLSLFWTSPSIFLGGVFFRTGKAGVALLTAILFYIIYKVAVISIKENDFQISKKIWIPYFVSIFLLPNLDQQGLFLTITVLVFLTMWGFFVRNKSIYIMLSIGVASFLLHELYRYTIAPQLTFMLNGYWPNFNYQTLPLQYSIQNLISRLSDGSFLYLETFRFLIGNPPQVMALGLILFFIFFPAYYLFTRPGLQGNDKKFFILTFVVLLITNLFMVIAMNALMVLRHPALMFPDVTRTYYWLSTNIMLAMTLAVITGIICKSRIPQWPVLMVMCFAIVGNIAALPKHKAIMMQGPARSFYESAPALLNALKNPDSLKGVHESLIEKNLVCIFLKAQKKIDAKFSAAIYDVRGTLYVERRQYQRAIENYDAAVRLKPDDEKLYYHRGNAFNNTGRYQLAIEDYNKAIRLKPDLAVAYANRGNAYRSLGHNQLAIEDYSATIRLRPDDARAYNNRGISYLLQGKYDDACNDAQKACALGDCNILKSAKGKGYCH
jgi:Flp pilus assembly protein TadD